MGKLTIITINTWKCDGDYYGRLKTLQEQLARLDADIILCQECFMCKDKNADTINQLGAHLGMHMDYVPGRSTKRLFNREWVASESGLGILSKYPIVHSETFNLPLAAGDLTRQIQQVQILLNDGQVIFVTNTHLTHISSKQNYRMAQAKYLADNINKVGGDYLHIIGGDFNAVPSSAEITVLKQVAGVVDCFTLANPHSRRVSLVDAFERGEMVCVDYIFAKAVSLKDGKISVERACVVLNEKDETSNIYPSDHFGICAQFKLEQ